MSREPRRLFLSASIPDPQRRPGPFDALAVTDAVVALTRTFLAAGWGLVTAAHPTIAPLLLYVAGESSLEGQRRIVTYQSALFADVLPTATRRFEAAGIARFEWTEPVEGDRPRPGESDRSLELMRRRMLTETQPDTAVFVGGMEGVPREFELFGELRPGAPRYALGAPGGEARNLPAAPPDSTLHALLAEGVVFPELARAILDELEPPTPQPSR
jgi:hypothetical protein